MLNNKKKILNKILIVGFGSIGERHLRVARGVFPAAEIALLRRKRSDSIPNFADICITSVEEAIRFSPQISVICNPATEHIKIGSILIKNKSNLLIEKPISASTEGVVGLLDEADKLGLKIAVGYNLRFNKSLNKFKEIIESGIAGKIITVRAEIGQYLPGWRPGRDYRRCVSAQQKLGGGVLNELSHEIDYIQWIFGEIKSVQAELGKFSKLELDVEDVANLIFKLNNKQDQREIIVSLSMDFVRQDTTRACQAICEHGTLKWDAIEGSVKFYQQNNHEIKELYRETTPNDESYLAEWVSFKRSIEYNEKPICDGYSAFSVLKVIESAKNSSKYGKRIDINSVT